MLYKRWQQVCRILHAVEVCKPPEGAVFKRYGTELLPMLGGTTSEILTAGKIGKIGGTTLGAANILFTAIDGATSKKGWQNHHTADILVSSAEIGLGLFEATSPIGWAFGVGMFVGNLISEHYTGKTITENLFDNE